MTAALHDDFAAIAALVVGIVLSLPFVAATAVAVLSYGRDLWQLILLLPRRRIAVGITTGLIALLVFAITAATIGRTHPAAVLFAVGAITPWTAMLTVRLCAWHTDGTDIRASAALAHNAEAARLEIPLVSSERRWPWSTYLIDVERARRQQEYEPPPI
jgi:hypothetical protein